MITCSENDDGSFTLEWDENDPVESMMNDWTEEDFVRVITEAADRYLAAERFLGNYEGPLYAPHPDLQK
jgi:hypothetical protein